jgi:DNA-directed RNA polymerase subunit RPC12/RpoP
LNKQKEDIVKEELLMCSTCDYKRFESKDGKLQQGLGMGSLVIRCDENGKNYRLAVNGEPKSEYVLYWCPTCGSKLF